MRHTCTLNSYHKIHPINIKVPPFSLIISKTQSHEKVKTQRLWNCYWCKIGHLLKATAASEISQVKSVTRSTAGKVIGNWDLVRCVWPQGCNLIAARKLHEKNDIRVFPRNDSDAVWSVKLLPHGVAAAGAIHYLSDIHRGERQAPEQQVREASSQKSPGHITATSTCDHSGTASKASMVGWPN